MTGSTTMMRETQAAGDQAVLTIGGEPRPGAAGTYPVHNPARPAEIVGHAPAADSAQLDAAVAAARRAAPGWRALSVAERIAAFAAAATTAAEQLAARDGARLYTREHGKVLSEANFEIGTGPNLAALIGSMAEAALALIRALKYVNAGTVEFIYDVASGKFFFIEMNTRIQVEHPVTEMLTGTDLVREQFRVAAGEPLSFEQPRAHTGCAIEFRINAENADLGFRPSPGLLKRWRPPQGRDIRIDSHAYEGYAVPPYYDSMLAKLIVAGPDRAAAVELAKSALARFQVSGLETTVPFHARLLQQPEFARGEVHTQWVEENLQAVTH